MTTHCDLQTALPDWLIDHPETWALVQELGLDYSCGGKSLESACRERGLNAQAVFARFCQQIEAHRNIPRR